MTTDKQTMEREGLSRPTFVDRARLIHRDHFLRYLNLPEWVRPSTLVEPVCRVHGPFRVSASKHLGRAISGGCSGCEDPRSLTSEQVDALCRDTLPNADGDPWTEEVFKASAHCPVYAVSSRNGVVYDRLRRWKKGHAESVTFAEAWDTHLAADLAGTEYRLGQRVISTFRPIMFQEGYWIDFKDGNPGNCDLDNLNWVEKEDYRQRFWDEMYEEDIEWSEEGLDEDEREKLAQLVERGIFNP